MPPMRPIADTGVLVVVVLTATAAEEEAAATLAAVVLAAVLAVDDVAAAAAGKVDGAVAVDPRAGRPPQVITPNIPDPGAAPAAPGAEDGVVPPGTRRPAPQPPTPNPNDGAAGLRVVGVPNVLPPAPAAVEPAPALGEGADASADDAAGLASPKLGLLAATVVENKLEGFVGEEDAAVDPVAENVDPVVVLELPVGGADAVKPPVLVVGAVLAAAGAGAAVVVTAAAVAEADSSAGLCTLFDGPVASEVGASGRLAGRRQKIKIQINSRRRKWIACQA